MPRETVNSTHDGGYSMIRPKTLGMKAAGTRTKPLSIHNPMRAIMQAATRTGRLVLAPGITRRAMAISIAMFMPQYQGTKAQLPLMPRKRYWKVRAYSGIWA